MRKDKDISEWYFWTEKQSKVFEEALAKYDEETSQRWEKVAREVGGSKSAEQVQRHYQILLHDLSHFESGHVPIPNYKYPSPTSFMLDHQGR